MSGGHEDHQPHEVQHGSTDTELATIEGRKLFVGGLSWNTDDTALRSYFEHFGCVDEAIVVYNKAAQISRGFGFVTFAGTSLVTLSLEEKMAKQVFVGGLPENITSDQLKDWAETKWGAARVVNAIVVLNMTTKLTRGFGFVNFVDSMHVEDALNGDRSQYLIQGKQVEVKRAQTQDRRHQRGKGMGRGKGKGAGRGRGGRDSYQQFTPWDMGGGSWDPTNNSQGMMVAGNYVLGGMPTNGNMMYPAYGGFPAQPTHPAAYGGQQQQFFMHPTGEFVASNEAAANPQFTQHSHPSAMMPIGMGAMNNSYYPAQPVMHPNAYSVEVAMGNMTLAPPFPNSVPPPGDGIPHTMNEMTKYQAQHQQQHNIPHTMTEMTKSLQRHGEQPE